MKRKLTIALCAAALAALALLPALARAEFGIESFETSLRAPDGTPLLQAGGHPDQTTTVHFNTFKEPGTEPGTEIERPDGDMKDVDVTLPPGLIGDPGATSKCSQADIAREIVAQCPPASQVGIARITNYFDEGPSEPRLPLYNIEPPRGVAGQFAFNIDRDVVYIDANVTVDGEYRLTADISNISQGLPLGDTSVTFWGVPAAHAHDAERFERGAFEPTEPLPVPPGTPEKALMSNPTSCTGQPLFTSVRADSWGAPGLFSFSGSDRDPNGTPLVISGCDQVPFEPTLTAQPTTAEADAPSGLDLDLRVPQNEFAEISTAHLRNAVITLPEGMALNPASAGGLASCSPAQIGIGNDEPPTCPDAAKVGSVRIDSPLIEAPLEGGVYYAEPHQNQFGSLLAIYLVVDDPVTGVLLKIPAKIETDPVSGRLVGRFVDAPQLPFERLRVDFFGGPRAAVVTPPTCGTYTTRGEFSPWSGTATVVSSDSFKIDRGPNGQPCPSGRFDPGLEAGTADPAAGRYSPFEVRISRGDGSQRLSTVSARLPKGLLARLAGIPYCADSALAGIPATEGTGASQLANPSCPAASRLGSVAVSAGAGPSPLWVKTGSAYLAGPYKGAPLSLAVVTPALAGPFDLGNVVVRVALRVDPETAQVTAVSDPLPTILQGIPLDLRAVQVKLDRAEFVRNPTSCAAQAVSATLVSSAGTQASASQPFAASSCGGLEFSPQLRLSLRGGTRRGAHPALTAQLQTKPGQANFQRVSVALPHSEFLAQEHIRTICTRVQFRAEQCPKASVYGYAEAKTPLLEKPLRGPVYLRSSDHELPDLVAALRGQIEIDLDGRIDSHNQGIRTTFESLPDAPISSFTLKMRGGAKSLLSNSTGLCDARHRATVRMVAQNGVRAASSPALAARCGSRKAK